MRASGVMLRAAPGLDAARRASALAFAALSAAFFISVSACATAVFRRCSASPTRCSASAWLMPL